MPPVLLLFAIAALYAVAALIALWRLAREWRALLDADWTPRDRELAGQIGFLLLAPFVVWLHEWGHAATMRAFGATDAEIHFFLYWGFVSSDYPFTAMQEFWVSLMGPLTSWVLGWALLALVLLVPLRPAVALALATCGVTTLSLILLFYPAWSLLGGWGDYVSIYGDGGPLATAIVGVAHALSLGAFAWLMSRIWMRGFMAFPCAYPWRYRWTAAPPEATRGAGHE